jgi:hypothetical protein
VKTEQEERRQKELFRWWALSLDPEGETPYTSISDYAVTTLRDIRLAEAALETLAKQLPTCKAKTPRQLRQWCYKQIDKQAPEDRKDTLKKQRKNTKPFQYEQHGNVCFIPLFDANGHQHIWTIPADWLEQAKLLWPVHIRHFSDGKPHVSRKVATPHGQKNVPIHRLFLGLSAVRHQEEDNLEVQNRDGNWLNYCNGNLFLAAGSDMLDHATAALEAAYYTRNRAFDPRRTWRTPSTQ